SGQNRAGIVSGVRRILAAAVVFAAACGAPPRETHVPQPGTHSEMKTIDSADVRPAVMAPPPMPTEEAPPPKPTDNVAQADAPPPLIHGRRITVSKRRRRRR